MKGFATLLALALISAASPAMACNAFVTLNTEDMKAYRDKLADTSADPLDRYFAFEQLACSDSPPVRAFASKMALEGNSDPITRAQVLLHILTNKKQIVIQLSPSKQSTKADQQAISTSNGQLVLVPKTMLPEEGCVSFTYDCDPKRAMLIIGERVELGFDAHNSGLRSGGNSAFGEFRLTETNELVGSIRLDTYSNGEHGSVDALIRLD